MTEKLNPVYEKKKKKSFKTKLFITIASIVIVIASVVIFVFHLTEVDYVGNKYYSDTELEQILLSDNMSGNSLFVFFKYNLFYHPELPFVQKISVRMKSPSHLEFEVLEKVTAGCVDYMGTYMYFDNEGVVVESSATLNDGIPVISGLTFDHVTLGEKLPVEDDKIFNTILSLSQLIQKNKLKPDKVFFDTDGSMKLTFGLVNIALGQDDNLKLKVADAAGILPKLEGQCGTLHMENYSSEKKNVSFTKEDPPAEPEAPASVTEPSPETPEQPEAPAKEQPAGEPTE